MKRIITSIVFLLTACISFSQENYEFKELQILYADTDYEKLVKVAEKYTLSEKTKKNPEPYFWLAKGLYKISLSGTDDEKYKNAYKDAIKYLSKGMKYDMKYNEGANIQKEDKFVGEFQGSLFEIINNEASSGSFKRAKGWVVKYTKITQHLAGPNYFLGACYYFDADKTGARDKWSEAERILNEIESIESWSEADRNMLKFGVLYSALALKKSRQEDKAKALVGKVSQWFEEDPDWQTSYDEIVNNTGS